MSVIWITGLSGAGKTTLARRVADGLRKEGEAVVLLDGDELRCVLGADTTNGEHHGREARLELAFRYAKLCGIIASQGVTAVVATISLFKEVHEWNRKNLPGYFEVYLKVPLEELRRRDSKGIYRRFDEGATRNIAGLDLPVDEPESPDVLFDHATVLSVESMTERVLDTLKDRRDKR